MHEFSHTQHLLDTALKSADSRRIVNVNILIGPFSDEREESIRFYWRDLAKGTPAEGAVIHFHHMEASTRCFGCGGTVSLNNEALCAYCESDRSQLSNGDEVRLESLEFE